MYKFISNIYATPPALFSRLQVDRILEDDFNAHYSAYKKVLTQIRPVKLEHFHEEGLVTDVFFRTITNTPITPGDLLINNLKAETAATIDTTMVIQFSNKLDSIWGTLKAIQDVKALPTLERFDLATQFVRYYKDNTKQTRSIMDHIGHEDLTRAQSKIDGLISLLNKKLVTADIPALIDIHTFVKMQSTLGSLISQQNVILIVGPAAFVAAYHILKDSSTLEAIIKGCLYNQQTIFNLKSYNSIFHFLSTENATIAVSEIGADLTPEEAFWYYR